MWNGNPHVWLVDGNPARDVAGSDVVGVAGETALDAQKGGLALTVGLGGVTASGALPRGVLGVNEHDGDACNLRLVNDLLLQIIERPSMVLSPLATSNRYPFAYTLELFKGDAAPGVFCLLNYTLGDAVIHVFSKASLFAAALLHHLVSRFRPRGLQLASKLGMSLAKSIDVASGEPVPVTVRGNVLDAKVNTKEPLDLSWGGSLNITGGEQIELAADQAQVRFSTLGLKQSQLVFAANKRDVLTPASGPNRDLLPVEHPRQDAVVIGNRAAKVKRALLVLARLVGICNFGNAAHGHLCCQIKARADHSVRQTVKRKLLELLVAPRQLADFVASSVGSLKRLKQRPSLLWSRSQFHLSGQSHNVSIFESEVKVKGLRPYWVAANSSSPLNGAGLLGPFL